MMRRVLMVSAHFPPDTSAATHRVRLLAPHLERYGWCPTVVAIDPRDYEGRLDWDLAALVPPTLRVVRCRAWPVRWTRRLGVGDLGLRALYGLQRSCSALLRNEAFDALFITLPPTYPALLGPILKRTFAIPFVLDYQDPWVGAWGLTVGPGRNGTPDVKSRLSRCLAALLEPWTVRRADALTAVSAGTLEAVLARNPGIMNVPRSVIPIGGEPADFARLSADPRPNGYFDPQDGNCHMCYVGTLLPLGFETLRAVLKAVALVRDRRPDLYRRLRLHFFGTSNQTTSTVARRVESVARELRVEQHVTEIAPRVDYLDALRVLSKASVVLLMGSSETHYTASKLYPALLARRPILALYHEASSVADVLRRVAPPPSAYVISYNEQARVDSHVEAVFAAMVSLVERPVVEATKVDLGILEEFSAIWLAGSLAAELEALVRGR